MMSDEKKQKGSGLLSFFKKNYLMIIIAAVCVALLLAVGSGLTQSDPSETTVQQDESTADELFIQENEQKLKQLLEKIEGVGQCEVMITLESGTEYIYATESETNSYGTDSTYKTVTDGKSEKPVVIREIPPRIAGVAVVCEGGDSSQIKNTVLEVVKKTLGVDGAAVSISKRK